MELLLVLHEVEERMLDTSQAGCQFHTELVYLGFGRVNTIQ